MAFFLGFIYVYATYCSGVRKCDKNAITRVWSIMQRCSPEEVWIYKQILAGNGFLYSVLRTFCPGRGKEKIEKKKGNIAGDLTYQDVHDGIKQRQGRYE